MVEASVIEAAALPGVRRSHPFAADWYDKLLAGAAAVLLAAVVVALARGYGEWGRVPGIVWAHIATILVALELTPVMMLRTRGDAMHRTLGRVWAAALFLTALLSL